MSEFEPGEGCRSKQARYQLSHSYSTYWHRLKLFSVSPKLKIITNYSMENVPKLLNQASPSNLWSYFEKLEKNLQNIEEYIYMKNKHETYSFSQGVKCRCSTELISPEIFQNPKHIKENKENKYTVENIYWLVHEYCTPSKMKNLWNQVLLCQLERKNIWKKPTIQFQ